MLEKCAICGSDELHSYWFWEKEDALMRSWAMDTRLHFSICRQCGAIQQNPPVGGQDDFADSVFMAFDQGADQGKDSTHETVDWLQQFIHIAKEPLRALELYGSTPRFVDYFQSLGWPAEAMSIREFETRGDVESEQYDIAIGFDALSRSGDPLHALKRVRETLKPEGGVYIQETNPFAIPRLNQITLTVEQRFVFPFPTLMFLLYQAGFVNKLTELGTSHRSFFTKREEDLGMTLRDFAQENLWSHLLMRTQRNFYWAWVTRDLASYVERVQSEPDLRDTMRAELRKKPIDLMIIRDVCGASLLFTQEVATLRQSLHQDWPVTMGRIFDILQNDYALYDLLQCSGVPGLGVFSGIDRFHFNEKMVYMTAPSFFEKYFSQQDAEALCAGIEQAGAVVVGHLSSLL